MIVRPVVALALALALAACGEPPGTTLRLWAMGREGEVVTELVSGFERTHPGVRVEVQQLPFTSAHEKLLTAFVGEATPDVAQLGNTWIPELAALDALAPLDAEVAASQVVRPADYFAGIWDTNQIEGVLYGVPWYVDTRLVFYRPDALAAAGVTTLPVTWPDWLAAMRAIKAQVGPARYAILLPLDEYEPLIALALSADEPLLRDHGRWGNFRSAGFRRALRFYLTMFVHELAPVATGVQVSNPWDELARGYFAFFLHGPWSIGEFRRRLRADQQALWATAPLPGPTGPGRSFAGGSSLVVFRRTRHPREAWQLIEYLSQVEQQQRFYALSGDLPARRAAWDAPGLTNDPPVRAFRDQLERVRPSPPVPEWERIATEVRVVGERAARRVSPATTDAELDAIVDAAVTELDARADQILDKRRWVLARRGAP
ncbi:MAG TPA: sugar ABC transporter substrate-binding protein [Kofleriaceae bacterium]|nr:sugar ABC transporter substrate-binding protein [Kofleriaceae bacterium]